MCLIHTLLLPYFSQLNHYFINILLEFYRHAGSRSLFRLGCCLRMWCQVLCWSELRASGFCGYWQKYQTKSLSFTTINQTGTRLARSQGSLLIPGCPDLLLLWLAPTPAFSVGCPAIPTPNSPPSMLFPLKHCRFRRETGTFCWQTGAHTQPYPTNSLLSTTTTLFTWTVLFPALLSLQFWKTKSF